MYRSTAFPLENFKKRSDVGRKQAVSNMKSFLTLASKRLVLPQGPAFGAWSSGHINRCNPVSADNSNHTTMLPLTTEISQTGLDADLLLNLTAGDIGRLQRATGAVCTLYSASHRSCDTFVETRFREVNHHAR